MAGIVITWTPKGILELPELTAAAMADALKNMGDELSKPKGQGIGVHVNSLSYEVSSGLATVASTLVWPRTTGESWLAHSESDAEDMAETTLQAARDAIVRGVGD